MNKMIINRLVFHTRVKNWIGTQIGCTKIVGVQSWGSRNQNSSSVSNEFTHCIFESAVAIDLYSTSVYDRATVCFLLELQEIGFAPRNTINAPVDVRSSRLSVQSTSVQR